MTVLRSIAIALVYLCSSMTTAATLTFKDHGKELKKIDQINLELATSPQNWTVFEPHEKQERLYRVLPFNQLMDKVYGTRWRQAEEILFTCTDGYQPSIPTEKFLNFTAGLAFPSNATDPFELINKLQNDEKVILGPYYLVWDNLKSPALRAEGASDAPYQVVGIDLIQFNERFPKLAPGKSPSERAKRGFLHFRKNCLSCHSINGEGGDKAPELNIPMNVTEYWQPAPLKQWISDPSSIRWKTTMPGLNSDIPNRDNAIRDIIEYLKVMANNKRPPA